MDAPAVHGGKLRRDGSQGRAKGPRRGPQRFPESIRDLVRLWLRRVLCLTYDFLASNISVCRRERRQLQRGGLASMNSTAHAPADPLVLAF